MTLTSTLNSLSSIYKQIFQEAKSISKKDFLEKRRNPLKKLLRFFVACLIILCIVISLIFYFSIDPISSYLNENIPTAILSVNFTFGYPLFILFCIQVLSYTAELFNNNFTTHGQFKMVKRYTAFDNENFNTNSSLKNFWLIIKSVSSLIELYTLSALSFRSIPEYIASLSTFINAGYSSSHHPAKFEPEDGFLKIAKSMENDLYNEKSNPTEFAYHYLGTKKFDFENGKRKIQLTRKDRNGNILESAEANESNMKRNLIRYKADILSYGEPFWKKPLIRLSVLKSRLKN